MADQKITALTAVVTPADADVLPVVQDTGTTPITKKITWTVIKAFLKTYFDTLYIGGTLGATDNRIPRSDGTGAKTLQASGITIDDSDNIVNVGDITGKTGGIKIYGGAGSAENLELHSTSHATKGFIKMGSLTNGFSYDETNASLLSGHNSHIVNVFGFNTTARVIGAKDDGDQVATMAVMAANSNAEVFALRSNGTLASKTIVADTNVIFQFGAMGYDGVTHFPAGIIEFLIDGTPDVDDMPGGLKLATTPQGSSYPVTAVFIRSNQNFEFTDEVYLSTGRTTGDAFHIGAYDVDGSAYVPFMTMTAGNTPTADLADSVTKAGGYIYRAGGTDVPVTDGGTGASDASGARTNLGLVIGTNVQAYSAALGQIAGLSDPNADRILFWDDSAGTYAYLEVGSGLDLTGTTLTATGGSGTPRRNLGLQLDTAHMQVGGSTSPTDTTTQNGITCSHAASAGANSYAQANMNSKSAALDFYDRNPEFNFVMRVTTGAATGTGIFWFGDTGGILPSRTQTDKSCFVLLDVVAGTGTWYLVNATGSANTNTSMASITAGDGNSFRIIKNGTTNIKCYANYVLKATSTTNLPAGDQADGLVIMCGTDNGAADSTARAAEFGWADILLDSPTT